MRIAQVTPFFLPVEGGVERHVLNLSRELVRLGHQVDIYTSSGRWQGKALDRTSVVEGLRVRRYRPIVSLGEFGKVWPGFVPEVISGGYDVVHSHVLRHPHTDLSNLAAKTTGSTSVLTSHSPFHPAGTRGALANALVPFYDGVLARFLLRSFDRIICLTPAEAKMISRLSGKRSGIKIIPHGIEEAHFGRVDTEAFLRKFGLEGRQIILSLGRIHPTKGLHWLVEAFSKVEPRFSDARLVLAGPCQAQQEIEYASGLRETISRLGLDGKVVFTSRLTEEEKFAAYDACALFVLPSLYEPYGIVLLEASAHGKPLLSTATDGPISIVQEGVNGYLFRPGDTRELARLLEVMLSDDGLSRSLGDAARKLVVGRRWDRVARATALAYAGQTEVREVTLLASERAKTESPFLGGRGRVPISRAASRGA